MAAPGQVNQLQPNFQLNLPATAVGTPAATVCANCGNLIVDQFLLSIGDQVFHEACAECAVCQCRLDDRCYFKDGAIFCPRDYIERYYPKCRACFKTIYPEDYVMNTDVLGQGGVYHISCFSCYFCRKLLVKGDHVTNFDNQLCCIHCAHMIPVMNEMRFEVPVVPPGLHALDISDDEISLDEFCNFASHGNAPDFRTVSSKRPRTILTGSQRRKFRASFELNPKPSRKVRETLAQETGLSVRVVQVWFQNQRAKIKKIARRQTPSAATTTTATSSAPSDASTATATATSTSTSTSTATTDNTNKQSSSTNKPNEPSPTSTSPTSPTNPTTGAQPTRPTTTNNDSQPDTKPNRKPTVSDQPANVQPDRPLLQPTHQPTHHALYTGHSPIDRLYSMQAVYLDSVQF